MRATIQLNAILRKREGWLRLSRQNFPEPPIDSFPNPHPVSKLLILSPIFNDSFVPVCSKILPRSGNTYFDQSFFGTGAEFTNCNAASA